MNSPAPRRALTLLALPALVVAMDQNVLFLALPTLTAELGASAVEQLWVSDIYGLMVAVFLIPFGALGDRIGRRRLLLAGSAGFAVFSLIAAFAPSVEVLIAARALLGIAGATIAPASLGLIVTLFPEPDERARAIGLWMGCFMVGIALGPSLGGLLLDHFWWGAVFLPGVPVMVTVLVGARRALPESEVSADAPIDVPGTLLFGTVMLSLFFGLKSAVLSSDDGAGAAVAGLVLSALALLVPGAGDRLGRNDPRGHRVEHDSLAGPLPLHRGGSDPQVERDLAGAVDLAAAAGAEQTLGDRTSPSLVTGQARPHQRAAAAVQRRGRGDDRGRGTVGGRQAAAKALEHSGRAEVVECHGLCARSTRTGHGDHTIDTSTAQLPHTLDELATFPWHREIRLNINVIAETSGDHFALPGKRVRDGSAHAGVCTGDDETTGSSRTLHALKIAQGPTNRIKPATEKGYRAGSGVPRS